MRQSTVLLGDTAVQQQQYTKAGGTSAVTRLLHKLLHKSTFQALRRRTIDTANNLLTWWIGWTVALGGCPVIVTFRLRQMLALATLGLG